MKPFHEYFYSKKRHKTAVLSSSEKKIAKSLRLKGVREQDILYLLNIGRETTLNSGRLSELDWDAISPCSEEELVAFEKKQQSWDFKTGLNPYSNKVDYILIKSKEAMMQAVATFNSPMTFFSLENFLILANVAWLYLFQAYCERKNINYHRYNNQTEPLSYMIESNTDFIRSISLDDAIINNIKFLISFRDSATHEGAYSIPSNIITKLQANCLNYNNTLISLFGDQNSLKNVFSIALQFASISLEQSKQLLTKDSSEKNMLNFVQDFEKSLSDDVLNDVKYQFSVTYVLVNNNKAKLADSVRFYAPGTDDYENIERVLIKEVFGFDRYKYTLSALEKELKKIDPSKKYRTPLLKLIDKEHLRDMTRNKSCNLKMVQAFPSGNSGVTWKYTEDFLDMCKTKILGIQKDA